MNKEVALLFLSKHQPFASDNELEAETLVTFREVLELIRANPDAEFLWPLINCFGDGTAFGLYETAVAQVAGFPPNILVPNLIKALTSPHNGVRERAAQASYSIRDDALVPCLVNGLKDQFAPVRLSCAIALENYAIAASPLREALVSENDEDVREAMSDSLRSLEGSPL
jgi:HEAT repeat protein